MSGFLFICAMICFLIGFVQLFAPETAPIQRSPARQPVRGGSDWPRPVQPGALGGLRRPQGLGSLAAASGMGGLSAQGAQSAAPKPLKLDWIEVGQRIVVKHPLRGELMAHVLGRVLYVELWQRVRGPQNPWVPTGSAFLGFALEGGLYLLNWQARFYLLEESVEVSDSDIQRDFLPYARQFSQSDQKADVYFSYPPAMWHIDDIGKFRIAETQGEAGRFQLGAGGRFIHSSGDSGRALVVEDYEGGSGQDTVWNGYQVQEADIAGA